MNSPAPKFDSDSGHPKTRAVETACQHEPFFRRSAPVAEGHGDDEDDEHQDDQHESSEFLSRVASTKRQARGLVLAPTHGLELLVCLRRGSGAFAARETVLQEGCGSSGSWVVVVCG